MTNKEECPKHGDTYKSYKMECLKCQAARAEYEARIKQQKEQ